MTETFNTNEGNFISAKEAALKYGYTSDYLGQLARDGKVQSKLVGHTRFLERGSLEEYINLGSRNGTEIKKLSETDQEQPLNKSTSRINEISIGPNTQGSGNKANTFKVIEEPNLPLRPEPVRIISKRSIDNQSDAYARVDAMSQHDATHKVSALLVAIVLVFGVYVFTNNGHSLEKSFQNMFKKAGEVELQLSTDAGDTTATVFDSLKDFFDKVSNKFSFWSVNKESATPEIYVDTTPEINSNTPNINEKGIVVLPSSGNRKTDGQVIGEIKSAFSDDVSVTLDESGFSGIIKPIFKETTAEQSYLYVLVPVRND